MIHIDLMDIIGITDLLSLLRCYALLKGKGEPYVRFCTLGGMPVRGTLILSGRHSEVGWPVPFLVAFNFPRFATGYPFAAGWTVSEHPNYDTRVRLKPSMFRTAVKRFNHFATRPLCAIARIQLLLVLFLLLNSCYIQQSCVRFSSQSYIIIVFTAFSTSYLSIAIKGRLKSFLIQFSTEMCLIC